MSRHFDNNGPFKMVWYLKVHRYRQRKIDQNLNLPALKWNERKIVKLNIKKDCCRYLRIFFFFVMLVEYKFIYKIYTHKIHHPVDFGQEYTECIHGQSCHPHQKNHIIKEYMSPVFFHSSSKPDLCLRHWH